MNKSAIFNNKFLLVSIMIVIAALTRILPHPPNFTPIAAMGLFGAAYFTKKHWAFIIPFLAMFLSDGLLHVGYLAGFREFAGFHGLMPWVYGAFALIIGIGFLLRNKVSLGKVVGATLTSSVLFFLISNFGVWLSASQAGYMPADFSGLMLCYTQAIPFFGNTLLGDCFFVGVLFGSFEWLKQSYPALKAN